MQVADILADICPAWATPSIQTAPLGFKPRVTGPDVVDAFTENVLQVCAHLVKLEQTTGKLLTLGLEPEPRCYLETTDETITYFQEHLYTSKSARRLAKLAGIPMDTAIAGLRRHLGIVFDIGHQAVGFEDIPQSLQKLVDAGIPIVKLQEAASMYIGEVTDEKIEALQRFAKTIYLSQTVECRGDHLEHYLNLEDAFAGWKTDKTPRQWRTHFHVPVFLEDFGPLHSTQFALAQALAMHKADAAQPPPRDRNLHLRRAPRSIQNRRHRRIRLPRIGVGQGAARIVSQQSAVGRQRSARRSSAGLQACFVSHACPDRLLSSRPASSRSAASSA